MRHQPTSLIALRSSRSTPLRTDRHLEVWEYTTYWAIQSGFDQKNARDSRFLLGQIKPSRSHGPFLGVFSARPGPRRLYLMRYALDEQQDPDARSHNFCTKHTFTLLDFLNLYGRPSSLFAGEVSSYPLWFLPANHRPPNCHRPTPSRPPTTSSCTQRLQRFVICLYVSTEMYTAASVFAAEDLPGI